MDDRIVILNRLSRLRQTKPRSACCLNVRPPPAPVLLMAPVPAQGRLPFRGIRQGSALLLPLRDASARIPAARTSGATRISRAPWQGRWPLAIEAGCF